MFIELISETEPYNELNADFGDKLLYTTETKVFLKFYIGPFTCSYYGRDTDVGNAILMAVQGFLSGEKYGQDVKSQIYSPGEKGNEPGIVFDGSIHPEIKTIIEQAIDLKTGNDRNKLMAAMRN
jgi:hypothetical protein